MANGHYSIKLILDDTHPAIELVSFGGDRKR